MQQAPEPTKPTEDDIDAAQLAWDNSLRANPLTKKETDDIAMLHHNMERFQIPPAAITRLLIATGAVIGGSLPLQAVIRKSWDNSDMDIYLPTDTSVIDQWHGLLTAFGYIFRPGYSGPYMDTKNARLRGAIDDVRTYYRVVFKRTYTIQLVCCNNVPCVLNAVDLSCTTIRYDGQRLVALENIDLIRCKIAFLRFPLHCMTAHEATRRIQKYVARGITVLDYDRKMPYVGHTIDDLTRAYASVVAAHTHT